MKTILEPLREIEDFAGCENAIAKADTPVAMTGCSDTQKAQLIAALMDKSDYHLVITHDEIRARELIEDLRMYDHDVMYYPAKDLIFFSADVHGQAITQERLAVIRRLQTGTPTTIVTTVDGGMDACLPYTHYKKHEITLKTGDKVDLIKLSDLLTEMGYENAGQVDREGEFCVRGGILDIYPETEETAYRIDLWDDEIDSIKSMDVESQRSIESLDEVKITPASEMMLSADASEKGIEQIKKESKKRIDKFKKDGNEEAAKRLSQTIDSFLDAYEAYHGMVNLESYIRYFSDEEPVSFFDYFKELDTMVFIDEPTRVKEKAKAVETEFVEAMKMRLEQGYILPKQAQILYTAKETLAKLNGYRTLLMSALDHSEKAFEVKHTYRLHIQGGSAYNGDFSMLTSDLKRFVKGKYRVLILSASETRGKRLVDGLADYDIVSFYDGTMNHELLPGEVMVSKGNLRRGFEYPDQRFVVLSESDIFGARRKKKRKKRYDGASIHTFNDLKIGDYVVHEAHGLGVYQGIEKIETGQVIKDYLKVSYAGDSTLYVPATSLELLQKYAGADAKPPKINKLGTNEWKKTKSRVKKAVEEIAEELVELYAKRRENHGHAFEKDTVWQQEFEEMFPYEETEDQLHAIEDVKKDMESDRIMDRLICGDVGYGKTEIAIRAAFKAVMDSKQVAVLVPTTILASQHYSTFLERMKKFGVNVELLCRLRTPAEQRQTIAGLKKGSVDVVIGTHKLLGKNVEFKNLGLLIIDEEQRFGVKHKEKLKMLKDTVDVLTLTATPIPRTLHMSLVGIRDMSVLAEPPEDRMPIQTFVMERSDEIVREAIIREIGRGGQVYYIYNRVNNIEYISGSISKLVPEATVAYAHGQMSERELEDTMYRFIEGDVDVLVATTIVESGLDIPNVNTIIVEDADRLGLSQLYQLRGRVGRSGRGAYAFLMYRRDKLLKEVAEKRLAAIREFTELGSGFRISMRDLELRGAGNLLGTGQHGHMAAVGYDMYCKMLEKAVRRLKGESLPVEDYETTVEIKVDAFIPVGYIKNEFQKLDVYKRIAEVETKEEAADMKEELIDRFGEVPKSVENLLSIVLIKARAHKVFVTSLEEDGDEIKAVLYPEADIDPMRIPPLIKKAKGKLLFEPERTVLRQGKEVKLDPYFHSMKDGDALSEAEWMISQLEQLTEE